MSIFPYLYSKLTEIMEIGDKVIKISRKPFKSGKQIEEVVKFDINQTDPKKRECAVFQDGSVCNVDMIRVIIKHCY